MATLADLQAEVATAIADAATIASDSSAVIKRVSDDLTTLKAQLGTLNPADQAALDKSVADLGTVHTSLAASAAALEGLDPAAAPVPTN